MISITSQTIKSVWTPILFLFISCIVFLTTLFYGIRIDSLSLGGVYIEKLYIKLHKKLIVSAKEVRFDRTSSQESSREEIVKILQYLPWMNRLFSSISLERIVYEDETITLHYRDDHFFLDSDYMVIDISMDAKERGAGVHVKTLLLKDFNLALEGILDLDILSQQGFFQGTFLTHGIQGNVALRLKEMQLSYVAQTTTFASMEPFMDALSAAVELEEEIGEWIYKKIIASSYRIDALEGRIDLLSGEFFPYEMKGTAVARDVEVTFEPTLPPAIIQNLGVELSNNQLIFHIQNASYEGVDVSDSKVHIYNLLTEKNGIVIALKTKTLLDARIHRILRAYDIHIPVIQTGGLTDAALTLDIRFLPYSLDAKGVFHLHKAKLLIADVPFYAPQGTLLLDNTTLTFRNAHLHYEELFSLSADGVLETTQGTFEGNGTLKHFYLAHQDDIILSLENFQTPLKLDFSSKDFLLSLPRLATHVSLGEKENRIILDRLDLLYPHSPLLQDNGFMGGKATVLTKDFETYAIDLDITPLRSLLYKQEKPLEELHLTLHVDANKTLGSADGLFFQHDSQGREVHLENIDVGFNTQHTHSTAPLFLKGTRSHLLLQDQNRSLPFTDYTLYTSPEKTELVGDFYKGNLRFLQTPQTFEFTLSGLDDGLMNHLAKKNFFDGGTFALLLRGKDTHHFSGSFSIQNAHVKQMVAYNNLIALLNTIPSLALFKGPGFNEKGYEIKEGEIIFSQEGDVLTLHAIHLQGTSADILGQGVVNLKDETLHVDIQLKTLKDISNALSHIPLLNHIILGEDQSIATAVKIHGKLENPEVTTQVLQDALLSPYNILKRTLELPFRLFQ